MLDLKYTVQFLGKRENDTWKHFAWLVSINGVNFEYNTGLGHFTAFVRGGLWGDSIKGKPKGKTLKYNSELQGWLHVPELKDVLHGLFLDTECGSQSFDDFCGNCGYDNDSLKALDVYRACMAIAPKLRQALGTKFASVKEEIEALNA